MSQQLRMFVPLPLISNRRSLLHTDYFPRCTQWHEQGSSTERSSLFGEKAGFWYSRCHFGWVAVIELVSWKCQTSLWTYCNNVKILLPWLEILKSLINICSGSLYHERAVTSQNMVKIVVGPDTRSCYELSVIISCKTWNGSSPRRSSVASVRRLLGHEADQNIGADHAYT